jgi:hypothetical protein
MVRILSQKRAVVLKDIYLRIDLARAMKQIVPSTHCMYRLCQVHSVCTDCAKYTLYVQIVPSTHCMYRLTNQMHCNYISLYFFSQWLLHVSAKQCHPQGATIFLSEPLQRQYGRRQVIGHMTEHTHRRAI